MKWVAIGLLCLASMTAIVQGERDAHAYGLPAGYGWTAAGLALWGVIVLMVLVT